MGKHGGSPRLRLVLNPHGQRLLLGVHRSWGAHLTLGTNLIIDHFLQDAAWRDDLFEVLQSTGATVFCVGGFEGRPLGLARRSDELCHSHQLKYDATVSTDRQSTAESVESVVAALKHAELFSVNRPDGCSDAS